MIDDPGCATPNDEVVTFYSHTSGPHQTYVSRPAFVALQTFQQIIPGSRFERSLIGSNGLHVLEFSTDVSRIHVAWTINCKAAWLPDLYHSEQLAQATCMSRDGLPLAREISLVTESPIYLTWPLSVPVSINARARPLADLMLYNAPDERARCYYFRDEVWQGAVYATSHQEAETIARALHPERLVGHARTRTLRQSRNAIWTIADPRDTARAIVVKQPIRLSWNKKITEPWKPSKAIRSWNGACQLLRRGIESPHPIAYFERVGERTDPANNWYVCELSDCELSVRHYFREYADHRLYSHGVALDTFLQQLCKFVLDLHQRGVHFRDLSSGNVLVRQLEDGGLQFSLIDTARAHFYQRPLPMHKRLSDLVRIMHKLHWAGRLLFLERYFVALEKRFGAIHKLHFHAYDLKAGWKSGMRQHRSAPAERL